jgi:GH15 family glucan-1,4-alpha-glucosidase
MAYQPIEEYGLIGDMHTVALVSADASIDYMCMPHFDSPTMFAALLDDEKGGRFRIAAQMADRRVRQFYIPDTNILMTRFLGAEGVAEVIDFMPTPEAQHAHRLVRLVKTIRGRVAFEMLCAPRFDYARARHTLQVDDGQALFIPEASQARPLRLHASVNLETAGQDAIAHFTLAAGEEASFVLEVAHEGRDSVVNEPGYAEEAFARTLAYWRQWMAGCTYSGRWAQAVNRSALAMKLMTSAPCGSLAAAATFGLPESIKGERNWDYRYAWIRDGSLTAATLVNIGFHAEAQAFANWILDRYRESEDGQLQIMYGIDGRRTLTEKMLDHLDGYMGSHPVRIGNGAYSQLQLDIYGELLLFLDRYDACVEPIYNDLWCHVQQSIDWLCENWDHEDEGVWEVRGGQRKFLYSRLMAWVGISSAIRIAERRDLPASVQRWRQVRDSIHDEIYENFWDADQGVFTQYRGSTVLDASCLLMPITGFVAPRDPRWLSTLDAIGEQLVDDSLVYRYRTNQAASDGLSGSEGTFSMCTFWYVDCLARAGRIEEARLIFEKMLHYAGPPGLYAEELGPTGEHLGNYPQAFTHLGLVGAARSLDAALDSAAARAGRV